MSFFNSQKFSYIFSVVCHTFKLLPVSNAKFFLIDRWVVLGEEMISHANDLKLLNYVKMIRYLKRTLIICLL